ncbi:MAG: virulence factor family protein [Myxococcales bacterium]|nr:virulence factor family protein [Myxococcales bacterium]
MANPKSVSAGRGLVFITAAKLWFMVAGYVIQFALPRALGSPARYGVWVVVLSILSPVNNVMVTATIQGVSKFTAEIEARQSSVLRAALKLQSMLGGGVALAFFLLAPLVAWFEHDPTLVPYLRLSTGVALAYAFYAVFVGWANGRKEFHKQAGLDITYSTLRCLFVVGAAAATHSAMAAVGGFVAAASIILVVAVVVVGLGSPSSSEPFEVNRLVRFFGGVAFYLLIVNLLMFADGLLLKRVVSEWATARGLADPTAYANEQAGLYGAVQNVARIPYQLILAVTFVIFPLVSKSTFDQDLERTRGYVRATMRYSLVVAALFAAVLAARPEATMRLFYKPEYAVGARALSALVLGYVCFSLFNIAGTIINGAGRTLPTTIIGVVTLAATVAAEWIGIRIALETGSDPLFVAAATTAATMGLGVLLSGAYLYRTFRAFMPALTLVRVALAYAAALATGWAWTRAGILPGKVGTLVSCAAVGIVYLVVCVVTGELRPSELKRLRAQR